MPFPSSLERKIDDAAEEFQESKPDFIFLGLLSRIARNKQKVNWVGSCVS